MLKIEVLACKGNFISFWVSIFYSGRRVKFGMCQNPQQPRQGLLFTPAILYFHVSNLFKEIFAHILSFLQNTAIRSELNNSNLK